VRLSAGHRGRPDLHQAQSTCGRVRHLRLFSNPLAVMSFVLQGQRSAAVWGAGAMRCRRAHAMSGRTQLRRAHYTCRPWAETGDLARAQESEGEEAAEQRVTLAEDLGRGNLAARQSRVRLQEVRAAGGRPAPGRRPRAPASPRRRRERAAGGVASLGLTQTCVCDGAARC